MFIIIALAVLCLMIPAVFEVVCALIGVVVGIAVYVLPTLALFAGAAYILAALVT